jgi:hypothetical protein
MDVEDLKLVASKFRRLLGKDQLVWYCQEVAQKGCGEPRQYRRHKAAAAGGNNQEWGIRNKTLK